MEMTLPSDHLGVAEVQCKCGCGLAHLRPALVNAFEALRTFCCMELGRDCPIHPSSGFRCTSHNESIVDPNTGDRLSSPFSRHMIGEALDLATPHGMTVDRFYELAEQVPEFKAGGIGIYSWGIHVDIRGNKARWDRRGK